MSRARKRAQPVTAAIPATERARSAEWRLSPSPADVARRHRPLTHTLAEAARAHHDDTHRKGSR